MNQRFFHAVMPSVLALGILLCDSAGLCQELPGEPALETLDTVTPHKKEKPPVILQGSVSTLQEAIASEGDVDWYAWYIACRDYLIMTGGLQCKVGTEIRFHKAGRIEAVSRDPFCLASANYKNFPLPQQTRLDILILPVRGGVEVPPAHRDEIERRAKEAGRGPN